MIDRVRVSGTSLLILGLASGATWLATGDLIASAGLVVLWLIWMVLPQNGGLPVLSIALTYHWMQNVVGVYYYHLTGREPVAMVLSDWQPMVWMGLGCITAIVFGITVAHDQLLRRRKVADEYTTPGLPWDYLIIGYIIAVVSKQGLEQFAWTLSGFNQGLLALGYVRLALFYVLMRRLVFGERYFAAAGMLLFEIGLGFTSYFAEFREPMMIAMVVAWERFDRRRVRDWVLASVLVACSIVAAMLWMGIRTEVRSKFDEGTAAASASARFRDIVNLASGFGGSHGDLVVASDRLIDRLWDVYYPALAAARIPNVLPHEDGALLMRALQHVVMPRFFFPDKSALESDSMLVRKYAGVWVAGPEQGTSIAFGYAIESYIDFGVPLMFVPVFAFGLFAGAGYYVLAHWIRDREISVGASTIVFWLALAQSNREWARMLGLTGTLLLFVGGAALLADLYLRSGNRVTPDADEGVASYPAASEHSIL